MSFDLPSALRRLKPQKGPGPLRRRREAELRFVAAPVGSGPPLLLDTTVYVDRLQGRLPEVVRQLLDARQQNHSSVAVAELSYAFGRLDPAHPETKSALAIVESLIAAIPGHRLGAPSVQAVIEAGILAGMIARRRNLPRAARQPLLNDAMLFLQAIESGFILLSRNIGDFDLLQQLVPAGRLLLYRHSR